MLPFLATFAFGIFIASFFVSVSPRCDFSEQRIRRFEQRQRERMEYDELRQENQRLRDLLNKNHTSQMDLDEQLNGAIRDFEAPQPPPLQPVRGHK